MLPFTPLPLIDEFLLDYNVGQVLLLLFIVAVLATLPLRSRKVLSINLIMFGLIFLLTPASLMPTHYKFLGIILLVISPLIYITARR
ncbi:MAG: hypothetical protein ABEI06_03725 [Halobacteriaceae archaeon]